jgi:hypothetical protein
VTHVTTVFDDSVIEYHLVVEESEGQVISLDLFDQTQLNEALDELDRRWVGQGGPVGHVHAPMRIRQAFAARDATALRDCVTDDSLAIDHRPLGVGTRDADQWAESMQPMFSDDGSTVPIWRQWARWDEHIGVYQLDLRTTDGSIWDIWVLQVVAGNRLAHTELFDRDELDLALARYDELRADTEHVRDPAHRAALARRSAPGARRRLGPRAVDEHAHDTG